MEETKTINHNYIKQLYTILDEEKELYQQIADVEKEKNRLLMQGVFIDLEPINEKIAELVKKSINIEQRRMTVSSFVTKELGIADTTSLKGIILALPEEYDEKFSKMYMNFVQVLEEIKRLNEINSKLISDTLRIIDVTLNAYVNEDSPVEINYGKQIKSSGKSSYSSNSPKLFSKNV